MASSYQTPALHMRLRSAKSLASLDTGDDGTECTDGPGTESEDNMEVCGSVVASEVDIICSRDARSSNRYSNCC